MPLFEISDSGMERHTAASLVNLGLRERQDIQRLLRDDIGVLDQNLLVVSEEFGNWEDARRRIDLLAIDKEARLVVIELKRSDDGGHMDLQALRYAAMVSPMVFDDIVVAYEKFLARAYPHEEINARQRLSAFLGQGDEDVEVSSDVRIVLVSGNFGREITTTVLWLNQFEGMDIRCVRLVPYQVSDRVLLDIQQVVPLPEAEDYQVRLRRKDQERERSRTRGRDFTRYHVVVDGEPLPDENKRKAIRMMVSQLIARNCQAERIAEILGPRKFRGIDGEVTEPDEMIPSVEAAYPQLSFDPGRWWIDEPFHQDGRTWLLSKMWGIDTEEVLAELSAAFPDAGISYRRATPA
jgi:hypothetical protein